jgi:septal ring factor EnvC (AmiA/AmiB activator)
MAISIDELLQDPAFRAKFLELLDRDPAFREEVRRKLLSEELLALPERMEQFRREVEEAIARLRQEMYEQFQRVWQAIEENSRQIAALTARLDKVEQRLDKVEQRLDKVEQRLDKVEQRLDKVEQRLDKVEQRLDKVEQRLDKVEERLGKVEDRVDSLSEDVRTALRNIGRMQERWGLIPEDLAEDQMPYILQRSQRVVRRIARFQYDGEADLVLEVEEASGFRFTLVLEVKGRVYGARPFEQVLQLLKDANFLDWLRRQGFPEPYVPAVFCMALYSGAENFAQSLGVGLYDAKRGEIFSPQFSTSS